MDRNKKKLFWLVLAGLFCIVFLTLLTISLWLRAGEDRGGVRGEFQDL